MHNAVNWNKISTEFVAKGEERFVTIGLFTGRLRFSDYMKLWRWSKMEWGEILIQTEIIKKGLKQQTKPGFFRIINRLE